MTNAPMPTVAVEPRRPVPEQVDRHLAELVVRWARQWADRETGMLSSRTGNPAGSLIASWGESVSGTDKFADVTGDIFFTGGRVPGTQFLVAVSGELCHGAP